MSSTGDQSAMDERSGLDESEAPLIEHLTELRTRLIRSFLALILSMVLCFLFAREIYQFLAAPLVGVLEARGLEPNLIITSLPEKFFADLRVSVYTGLYISFPFIANQLWRFVAPGLYQDEKSAFWPFLVATPLLFALGGALVYFIVSPLAFGFFVDYTLQEAAISGQTATIAIQPKVSEYLSIIILLIFAFGLAFQLPVLLTLMGRAGIVTGDGLARSRKYAVVGIVTGAALLTPPDVISQIGLAIPLFLLYEISIFLVRRVERKREERLEAEGYYDT